MRPNKPRFCNVVVVIGVVVGVDEVGPDGAVSVGVVSGVASWAGRPAAAVSSMEKVMARRIIDGLNTKR